MLRPEQRERVIKALGEELALRPPLQTFVRTTLAPYEVDVLTQIARSTTPVLPRDEAVLLLDLCVADEWTRTPSLLERVVARLVAAGQGQLNDILQQVQQKTDPNPDPTQALWVTAELPFFSRSQLRPLVSRLLKGTAQPILQIVGPMAQGEECGKSYTLQLIQHAAANSTIGIGVAFSKIGKGLAASFKASDLADDLIAQTEVDISTQPAPNSSSNYAKKLSTWILNAARRSNKRWIFVLDGFNQQDVSREVRDVVESLALTITTGTEFRRLFRLVLIDHAAQLPSVQTAFVLRENVPDANAVTVDEVADCLDAHYVELATHPTKPLNIQPQQSTLKTVATKIVSTAPPGPAGRLQAMQETLYRLRADDLLRAGR
jgi:hypothetical protein